MLVGLTSPSSGDALVRGLRITEDMQEIRKNLGVCPQHDILFPELTVLQHLQMFAAFKGLAKGDIDEAANKMIAEVGLVEKRNVQSRALSGGQKRKLSLGIALIGGSKVIILDEPTSGMDPYSRRSTWNVIQNARKGRIILLTTHFMDEADILGDRIAIMAHGRLQCVGSSLFLKSRYGVGYTLTVVKNQTSANSGAELVSGGAVNAGTDSAVLTTLVKNAIADAEPLSDVGAEISFRLPFSAADRFPALFTSLDEMKGNSPSLLGGGPLIQEYGIAVTTLEEVFLRVGKEESDALATNESACVKPKISLPKSSQDQNPTMNILLESSLEATGNAVEVIGMDTSFSEKTRNKNDYSETKFAKHFYALLMKRVIYGRRDKRMFVCQLVLPVLLVILGVALLQVLPSLDQPDLILSPSANQYNPTLPQDYQNFVPFLVSNDTGSSESSPFIETVLGSFDGAKVAGVAVPFSSSMAAAVTDEFNGCNQGATPLQEMDNFLLATSGSSTNSGGNDDFAQAAYDSEKGSSRYGALTLSDLTNQTYLAYNAMVNSSSNHGVGIYVNLMHSSFLQAMTGLQGAQITVHNHPLPPTQQQQLQSATTSAFIVALLCMIAFCFIPASFGSFVVKEREVKAKHQQVVSG